MFYLYILKSEIINSYYVGVSSDVEERLKRHLSNHNGILPRQKIGLSSISKALKQKQKL
ncbi:MAG: GIY-YIG nuclease family protein [Chryseobacterium sp.]|nr:GIY-YIG nuclease family protein [Chryseobacterium sp.]